MRNKVLVLLPLLFVLVFSTTEIPVKPKAIKAEVASVVIITTSTTVPPTTTTRKIVPRITTIPVNRVIPVRADRGGVRTSVNWQAIADCESGARDRRGNIIPGSANWSINTGNGYYGGLQFLHSTWISNGGGQYADNAHLTSSENQIAVASGMGLSHWPICKRYG